MKIGDKIKCISLHNPKGIYLRLNQFISLKNPVIGIINTTKENKN